MRAVRQVLQKSSSPFKGEVRRGMGLSNHESRFTPEEPHPHPALPLKGRGRPLGWRAVELKGNALHSSPFTLHHSSHSSPFTLHCFSHSSLAFLHQPPTFAPRVST